MGDHRRVVQKLLAVAGVLGQEGHHALQRGRHRVEAGDEEQIADVDHVVAAEGLAFDLGVEDGGQEVVLALGHAGVHHFFESGVDLLAGGIDHLPALLHGPGRWTDYAVFEGEELVDPANGQAQQLQEDGGRHGLGDFVMEVAVAFVGHLVDQLADELPHPGLVPGHLLGGEQRIERFAVLAVVGRVDLEGHQGTGVADVDRSGVGGEHLGGLKGAHHVFVAADSDGIEAASTGQLGHRGVVAQLPIGVVGISGDLGGL